MLLLRRGASVKRWLARTTLLAAVVGSMATSDGERDFTVFGPEIRRSLQPGEAVDFEVSVRADETIFENLAPQSIRVELRPDVESAELFVRLEPQGFGEPVELERGRPGPSTGCSERVTSTFTEAGVTSSGTYCVPAPLRCCEAFYRLTVQSAEEMPILVGIQVDALYDFDGNGREDDFVPEDRAIRISLDEVAP